MGRAQSYQAKTSTLRLLRQVRNGTNRMWPLKEEATPGATSAPDMIMARFLDIAAPGGRGSKKSSDLMGGGSLMQVRADAFCLCGNSARPGLLVAAGQYACNLCCPRARCPLW